MYKRLISYVSRKISTNIPRILKYMNPSVVGKIFFWTLPRNIVCNSPSADYIFCINAAAFQKDIDELSQKQSLNFIIIDQEWFSLLIFTYFSDHLNYLNHFYGVEAEETESIKTAIKRASDCLDSFVKLFESKHGKIRWFLLPSFNQGGVTFINHYASETNRKVLCFYYEHYTCPIACEVVRNCFLHYKSVSPGGKILVWHENMKNILVDTNFAKPENVIVSGPPRFHRWFDIINQPKAQKKHITLLSFPGNQYLAPFTYTDILLCFKEMSLKYLDYHFVVKCKDAFHIAETLQILNNDVGNLHISSEIDMIDLLKQSKVIIGYNSLSFLEALLSPAHLILPFWADSKYAPYMLQIDPADQEAQDIVNIAYSREHFQEILDNKIQGPDYEHRDKKRINYLNKFIYFDPSKKSIDIFEKIFLEKS